MEDMADLFFTCAVLWVSLAAEDQLQRTNLARNGFQPLQVGEEQFSPLVRGRPARKANRQDIGIKLGSGLVEQFLAEQLFGLRVSGTYLKERNSNGITEIQIVAAPFRNVSIKKLLKGL